jgi:hypothetical protein
MAEAAHLGADGIRFNDGLFDTDNRYFREVSSGALSKMVAGPSIKLHLDTSATDTVGWAFKVGSFERANDIYGNFYGYPTNTVTEFAL